MLNKADLDFIKESRTEMRTLREESIRINIRALTGSHPVTDEPIYDVSEVDVDAVVTRATSPGLGGISNDKEVVEGIKVVTGDIIIDINLEDFPVGAKPKDVDTADFEDVKYKIVSYGTLGLGESNRIELLGRRAY